MNAKAKGTLSVQLTGRDVELTCRCGFTLRQSQREVIAERCPRCGREWRR